MQQILQGLVQLSKWYNRHWRVIGATQLAVRDATKYYQKLSPEMKAKVEHVVISACGMIAKIGIDAVLRWVDRRAEDLRLDKTVVSIMETAVKQGASVGIDHAIDVLRGS